MVFSRAVKRLDIFWCSSLGWVGSSWAILGAPSPTTQLVWMLTLAVSFCALWGVTQLRLADLTSPRWLEAYPAVWQRAVGVAAVVSLVLAIPLFFIGAVLAPSVWFGLGCAALAIVARDSWALLWSGLLTVAGFVVSWQWPAFMLNGTSSWLWWGILTVSSAGCVGAFIASQRSRLQ